MSKIGAFFAANTGLARLTGAAALAAIGVGGYFAFQNPVQPPADQASAPASSAAPEGTPNTAAVQPEAESGADTAPEPAPPRIDEVRVNPDGLVVIAGRAAPGSTVAILLDGQQNSETRANGGGAFATISMIEPSDAPRVLTVVQRGDGGDVAGTEEVILAPIVSVQAQTATDNAPSTATGDAPSTVAEATSTPAPAGVAATSGQSAPTGTQSASAQPAAQAEPAPSAGPTEDSAAQVAPTPQPQPAADVAAVPQQPSETPDAQLEARAQGADTPAVTGQQPSETSEAQNPGGETLASAGQPAADAPRAQDPVADTQAVTELQSSNTPEAQDTGADTVAMAAPQASDTPEAEGTIANPLTVVAPQPSQAPVGDTLALATPQAARNPVAETSAAEAQAPDAPAPSSESAQAPRADTTDPATPRAATGVAVLRSSAEGVRLEGGPEVMDSVALDTIGYSELGGVQLSGRAQDTASAVRVYIDNRAVATLPVDDSGRWRGDLPAVDTGVYTLRIDEVDTEGGVSSRVETPFQRVDPDLIVAASVEGAPRSITVQTGATLWGIARERYGQGILFVRVFEANRDLIRDPDLIYPGQIFALPEE